MNKILGFVLALTLCSLPLSAQSPEAFRAGAQRTFSGLSDFKLQAQRSVRLTGEVELHGQGQIPSQDQGVYMLLSGSMDVKDEAGRVLARDVQVAYRGLFQVSGSYVSGRAFPEVFVPLYKNGRSIGSVKLSGIVPISGHASGTWALVSGRGQLWGYAALQD